MTFTVCGTLKPHETIAASLKPSLNAGVLDTSVYDTWVGAVQGMYAENPQPQRDEAILSGSLAAMTLMLAAKSQGLDSTPTRSQKSAWIMAQRSPRPSALYSGLVRPSSKRKAPGVLFKHALQHFSLQELSVDLMHESKSLRTQQNPALQHCVHCFARAAAIRHHGQSASQMCVMFSRSVISVGPCGFQPDRARVMALEADISLLTKGVSQPK